MPRPPEKVLFVDDEPNLLAGIRRQLRKRFHVDTALGGEEGLQAIAERGPFGVVVSDMRMPGMSGVEFLERVCKRAPETVRMMLTGNADQQTAIDAVNHGKIFRFLNKPVDADTLAAAVTGSIAQHRLIRAEKDLLERTLRGSVKILTDVLTMVNPTAFGRATRVRRLTRALTNRIAVDVGWQVEVAAMLSQVGCVCIPEDVLRRAHKGRGLTTAERKMITQHPKVAHDLISNVPRLEGVAKMILYQGKRYEGTGYPRDEVRGAEIPVGARILKIALDYDTLTTRTGHDAAVALQTMRQRKGWYDPVLLDALQSEVATDGPTGVRAIDLRELRSEMVLAADLLSMSGVVLVPRGQEISTSLLMRLENFALGVGVKEPIKIVVPLEDVPPAASRMIGRPVRRAG